MSGPFTEDPEFPLLPYPSLPEAVPEPDECWEPCPAHGPHPHDGRTCIDCPICRPPQEEH